MSRVPPPLVRIRPKLIASAIIKNEADRYLEPWLDHLLSFCDEVYLLDDSSDDMSLEIAQARPRVKVAQNGGPAFFEHESQARNALLEWTITGQPDYVLSIDADEFVSEPEKLVSAAASGGPVYSLTMREVWDTSDDKLGMRVDGLWGTRQCPILWRAPRTLHGSAWQIPNRKLACGREPLAVRRGSATPTGSDVLHFGWARRSEREERAARYFEHDGGRYHASKHLRSLLDPDSLVQLNREPWPEALLPLRERLMERACV